MYENIKRGYYNSIQGVTIYMRSGWELEYACYLDMLIEFGIIESWEYEPKQFDFKQWLKKAKSYLPDFKLNFYNGTSEYHEVKGYMDKVSKTKIKRFLKYYPENYLKIIDLAWFKAYSGSMALAKEKYYKKNVSFKKIT